MSTAGPRRADRVRPTAVPALIALLAAHAAACAPAPLTPAGARVALLPAPASGCALVAALRGSAGYNGRSGETNAADVGIYLRNQAAERGADALVITSRRVGAPGADGDSLSQPRGAASGGCPNCISVTANAYRCPSPRAAPVIASVAAPPDPPTPPASPPPAAAPTPAIDADAPFSAKAAEAALAAAVESARRCHVAGSPTGDARVKVTFATTGDVVYAEADDPFAGTPLGACIARKFLNARVPPFSGGPRVLSATVRIDE